jgi:hypothetical protein
MYSAYSGGENTYPCRWKKRLDAHLIFIPGVQFSGFSEIFGRKGKFKFPVYFVLDALGLLLTFITALALFAIR